MRNLCYQTYIYACIHICMDAYMLCFPTGNVRIFHMFASPYKYKDYFITIPKVIENPEVKGIISLQIDILKKYH